MERPIVLVMEEAKTAIEESVSDIKKKTRLPAVIIEGILCSVLADMRKEACAELAVAASEEKKAILKAIQDSVKKPEEGGADDKSKT